MLCSSNFSFIHKIFLFVFNDISYLAKLGTHNNIHTHTHNGPHTIMFMKSVMKSVMFMKSVIQFFIHIYTIMHTHIHTHIHITLFMKSVTQNFSFIPLMFLHLFTSKKNQRINIPDKNNKHFLFRSDQISFNPL